MRISRVRGLCLIIAGVIAVGSAFVAPAQAETTTGSITGQVLAATGDPEAGVEVFVSSDTGSSYAYVFTNSAGGYEATGLKPGRFTIQFTASWGGIRYYDGQVDVVAGGQTVVNHTLPATGALAGRLTKADGAAASGFQVRGNWNRRATVTTAADGSWRLEPVWAVDDNTVEFSGYTGVHKRQYAYGKLTAEEATPIAVSARQTTIVNDSLLPTGSVRVTATSILTGAPVPGFFAYIGMSGASEQNGAAVITEVPVGTHRLEVSAQDYYLDAPYYKSVTVVVGQQADVAVVLVPESRIAATVVDAATGQPVEGVCVEAISSTRVQSEDCYQFSDENGQVTMPYLRAGAFRLLAVPSRSSGYGAQWVGANGGTGRQHRAAVVNVGVGETATAPVIKLDRAGTITGTVTKADGAAPPRHGGTVGLLPVVQSSGALPPGSVGLGETNRYTLDFLGPYDWELFFTANSEAPQWSGGVANPLLARTVRVAVGQTTTYDFKFRAAVRVTLVITGLPPRYGYYADASNPLTGFRVAAGGTGDGGGNELTLLMVGPELARFNVNGQWFGGADFAHARTFWIPLSGSKTITLAY